MKKSASYSPLKGDISRKGLSQIMQQSYKDELENSKYQLAKLSNEQFLSRYIHLNNHMSAINQYKYLLQTPISQIYQRFQFNDLPKEENAAGLIKKAIQDGIKRSFAVLSKEDLKALASKKIGQAVQQERLSTSRKQKKEQLYDKLKSSRRREDKVNQDSPVSKLQKAESFIETIKKDASTEQPIQDIFMRLQPYGETRDYIKKKWYSWGQKGDLQQRKTIIEQWRENHKNLKYLLELLLQKLKVIYGSHHVYTFLNSPAKTSIIESPNTKKSRRSEQQRTSTSRIEKQLKQQDSKVIYRFSSWFNKILLDERQLEYIQSSKTLKSSQKKKPLNEETVYIDSPSKK